MRWYVALGSAVVAASASLLVVPIEADAQTKSADSDSSAESMSVTNAKRGLVIPPPLADVEEMCALLTGCQNIAFPKFANDIPTCVKQLWGALSDTETIRFSLGIRECALRSNSCSELRECALAGASADACKGRAMTSDKPIGFCDLDGRAISCWRGQPLFVRDCPRGGEQCSVVRGKPICSLGPCPESIKEGDSTCSTDGHRILTCSEGRIQSRDCTVLGLVCERDGSSKPACVPSTKKCTTKEHRCDGNAAVGCLDGHEVRVACGVSNMTCAVAKTDDSVGVCTSEPPDKQKCGKNYRDRCTGATVDYCANGHKREFMCKAFGFNRCIQDRNGPRCAR